MTETAPEAAAFDETVFNFSGFEAAGNAVRLHYAFGAESLTEVIEFPFMLENGPELTTALRLLHLVAGTSYYKCVAPVPLRVESLGEAERNVVRLTYDHGLREFAFRNDIDFPLPVDISANSVYEPVTGNLELRGALVPIGGGKDSALVADALPDAALMTVNPTAAHQRVAKAAGRDLIEVRRTLDPRLKELVAQGALNGHIPITAINSMIAVVVALSLGYRDVVMGIERSASEPTVRTPSGEVNHQFSKSATFETALGDALASTGIRYFSLLRGLSELSIGASVVGRGLMDKVLSCNRAFVIWSQTDQKRDQKPCGECAKCAFTALMFAPWTTPKGLRTHFEGDVLDNPESPERIRHLWASEKPWDCVGERMESAVSLATLANRPEWADQRAVRELAAEAAAIIADAGFDSATLIASEPAPNIPADYSHVVDGLARHGTTL